VSVRGSEVHSRLDILKGLRDESEGSLAVAALVRLRLLELVLGILQ
jgi:hypothetical protein